MATITREYRIVVPVNLNEYSNGILYTIAQMTKEDTSAKIRVLENRDHVHEKMGPCTKTLKVMDIEHYFPRLFRAMIPSDATKIYETSYNAFPVCETTYHNAGVDTKTFKMTIHSVHAPGPVQENIFDLPRDERSAAEVAYIDIAAKIADKRFDPRNFPNEKSQRPHLGGNWREECEKSGRDWMICYKLVTIDVNFISGGMIANKIASEFTALIQKIHQRMYATSDEWVGLGRSDIRKIEDEAFASRG